MTCSSLNQIRARMEFHIRHYHRKNRVITGREVQFDLAIIEICAKAFNVNVTYIFQS